MTLPQLNESELVKQAREGKKEAFSALVHLHRDRTVMIAFGILRNFELAKDASQNAFVKAYFGLRNFKEEAKFKTWLFRIVINEAKDVYRKERSRGYFQNKSQSDPEEESILELIPSKDLSPRQAFELLERKKNLERAVRDLPDREQEVFMLRYFHDLNLSEISDILGIATGTVKAHLAQGTEKLRARFFSKNLMVQGGGSHE